jgi:3-oxoacyl-[acyl-carrier-protein] synthase-3
MIRSRIIGTGHFLPEKVLTNKDLEAFCDTTDEWIRQRTGITQRHCAADGQGSSDLGAPAAQAALENAGVDAADVDLVLCCTTTPDHMFPSTACLIQNLIGATNAAAADMNAACSGFMYGLATADSFIRSGQYKTVLLVGAERVVNILDWNRRDTAVLFGDGAGAVVVQAHEGEQGVLNIHLGAHGGFGDLLKLEIGGSKYPVTAENVLSEDRAIAMKGQELFKKAVVVFCDTARQAVETSGISVDDIDLFVPHQANVRIIMAAADRLGLPREKVYLNIDRVGNTTAASIPIALDQANREGRLHEGSNILLASFGAGLTWASAMVRW